MNHMDDNKIKDAIIKGTDEVAELKNIVWDNIQKELNLSEGKVQNMKPRKNNFAGLFKHGSIAAAIAIVLASNTEYGHAAMDKIRELFAPNKTITQEIEGTPSQDNLSLKEGSAKYIIYIDEERYTMQSTDGKDKIVPKIKAENLPEVFMEIQQVKDKKPDALAAEIENELKTNYKNVADKEIVTTPISGIHLKALSGYKSNSTIVHYYLMDNTKGGTFIIKQQYFLEAEEGHGARFNYMLKEFSIVSE